MKLKNIFLSYRRDDSPGYVSKIALELEQAFGQGRVFRDVDDIKGGSKWKQVLQENLENAGALLVIIGPRWESIWKERKDHSSDYIVYELEEARKLDIPIIPVTLNGATLSGETPLDPVDWLLDNQTYDISDRQGRWGSDLKGLITLLENLDGIGKAQWSSSPQNKKAEKSRSGFGLSTALIGVGVLGILGWIVSTTTSDNYGEDNQMDSPSDSTPQSLPEPVTVTPAIEQSAGPVIQPTPDAGTIRQPAQMPEPDVQPDSIADVPDIAGMWVGNDGLAYAVEQYADGTFSVVSPGYGAGVGEFIPNMPNKFRVTLQGIGYGEYSVSADGQRIIGWFIENGTNQQLYGTLIRVE